MWMGNNNFRGKNPCKVSTPFNKYFDVPFAFFGQEYQLDMSWHGFLYNFLHLDIAPVPSEDKQPKKHCAATIAFYFLPQIFRFLIEIHWQKFAHRMWSIYDFDDVLHMDVVLLRIQGNSKAVVLPSIHRLVPHREHLTMHVKYLGEGPNVAGSVS